MTRPYQPSLLRLLHGVTALLTTLAWLTGLVVYSRFDGRFGRLPGLPQGDWINIHGAVGVLLWPTALLFGCYALSIGLSRLRWRANAAPLMALAVGIISGKLMDEDWLREGQFHHLAYSVHLMAWLLIAGAVVWHLVSVIQRGGLPLVVSMLRWQARSNDGPRDWLFQMADWWRRRVGQ